MAAIYCADLWCDGCADQIREKVRKAFGDATPDSDDETSYDSDEYPKYASDEESDSPQHCGSREDCVNAETLPDGSKVGMLFGSLTGEGIEYVKQAIADGGLVAELWKSHYEADGYDFT